MWWPHDLHRPFFVHPRFVDEAVSVQSEAVDEEKDQWPGTDTPRSSGSAKSTSSQKAQKATFGKMRGNNDDFYCGLWRKHFEFQMLHALLEFRISFQTRCIAILDIYYFYTANVVIRISLNLISFYHFHLNLYWFHIFVQFISWMLWAWYCVFL